MRPHDRRPFGFLLIVGFASVLTGARPSSAAEVTEQREEAAPQPHHPRWEWVGLEITPVGYAFGDGEFEDYSRRQLGPGGTFRVLRREWTHAYFTPLQVGLFVANGHDTIFPHAEIEGGAILPFGNGHRLELGLGAGLGILAITHRGGCDGSCNIGGAGVQLSPVVRYRVALDEKVVVGFGIRAAVPLQVGEGEWWGYFTGRGTLVLGALDFGFGS